VRDIEKYTFKDSIDGKADCISFLRQRTGRIIEDCSRSRRTERKGSVKMKSTAN
jgi:hypothetical protein